MVTGCTQVNARYAMSEVERNLDPDVTEEEVLELADGNSEFACDFYQEICDEHENLIFSPFGTSMLYSMGYAGTDGETAEQMEDVLRFTLEREKVHSGFNRLENELTTWDEEYSEYEFKLNIANSLWARAGYEIKPDFLNVLAENYGAGYNTLNLNVRDEAAETINQWISDETEGFITELVSADDLNDWTQLGLLNAIYFEAKWLQIFEEESTTQGDFHLLDGSTVMVDMMMQRQAMAEYYEDEDFVAVKLPYNDSDFSMMIILPEAGMFEKIRASIDTNFLNEITDNYKDWNVGLKMPRFSFGTELDLVEPLTNLGMTYAFNSSADFTRIADDQLFIDKSRQKSVIEVDEWGTKAASSSFMFVATGLSSGLIEIDHPFIFVIINEPYDTILFMGQVMDPSKH